MKTFLATLSASILLFSASSFGDERTNLFRAQQQACALKQAPRHCAVNVPGKHYIGRCVDAKAYGLICVHFKQR
ncbi:hypothetical protein NTE28_004018 [Vibrio harveyi]|nr:hypothetical protein [Vibrio harveyi]